MRRNERFELRLPQELVERLKAVAQERDTSVASVVRMALENEMRHGEPAIAKTERIVSASIDRLARDLRTLQTAQQAVFALTDSLARLFLTCVPEPAAEVLDQAKRRARLRYDRFLKSVAQNMTADSQISLAELRERD
jgi:predicted HicB family RNase H-like nuclease